MAAKREKTWGDIYYAALRRGCDNGYAAWLADRYEKRKAGQKRRRVKWRHHVTHDRGYSVYSESN